MRTTNSFYEFSGSWADIFDKLVGVIHPRNTCEFAIWESKSKDTRHVLITYGRQLPNDILCRHCLEEISEPDFRQRVQRTAKDHIIHGNNAYTVSAGRSRFLGL
jgi:hypothetical protein